MNISDIKLANIDPETRKRKQPLSLHENKLSPYLVYMVLKTDFGRPNALPDSDNIQWCYELKVPNGFVRVGDWNQYSWTLDIYANNSDAGFAESIGREFFDLIGKRANYFTKKAKSASDSSKFKIIQNPFKIYLAGAKHLLGLAESTTNNLDKEALCKGSFFLFLSSFEGLLNIIYDLYLKTVLHEESVRRGLQRANIDLKLRLAPLYCMCFIGDSIKYKNNELDRYMSIVELRNDFIHANLSPTMRTSVVKLDGYTFPLEERESNKYSIPKDVAHLDITHLHFVNSTIEEMKDAVLSSMHHKFRKDFQNAISREQIITEQVQGENLIRISL
ncbi:MAG TPA: hypothetical protein VJV03_13150 [Pyrinomonadaceae bacterium]|nr:hypothetical protein [Pyrinomonadaceae bacterium]